MSEGSSLNGDPREDEAPIRKINVETPGASEPGEKGNAVTNSTLLSPPVQDSRFLHYVIKLLQSVITGNDDAIAFGIT